MKWIDAATAAERLGVKPATLYAYVSRGVLRRKRDADGRRSLFDPAEIEELARRGRPRRPPGPSELSIETEISTLGRDRHYYRGRDAIGLAASRSFETVAAFLWTGRLDASTRPAWHAKEDAVRAAAAAQRGLPPDALPLDRLQIIVPALAVADPVRFHLDREAVINTAGNLIAAMVEALPPAITLYETGAAPSSETARRTVGATSADHAARVASPASSAGTPSGADVVPAPGADAAPSGEVVQRRMGVTSGEVVRGAGSVSSAGTASGADAAASSEASGRTGAVSSVGGGVVASAGVARSGGVVRRGRSGVGVAERLWGRLCPQPVEPGPLRVLEAAMVLLADHELAASTVAARVAASVRADPYAVVASALGVVSGPLHGGASYGAERMLGELEEAGQAARVIGDRLRRGERIPGLGHTVYKAGDGRATYLMDLIREAAPGHPRLEIAEAVLAEARRARLPEPNVDFALATLVGVAGMVQGAGETVFAVARTAGWLAHALEEYQRGTLLRPRATYVGPPLPE